MSTTFDVLPRKNYIPTFSEIIELANSYINTYLQNIGIIEPVSILVNLHKKDESNVREIMMHEKVQWDDDSYIWFYLEGKPGGTDVYFWSFDETELDMWKEEISNNPRISKYAEDILTSINIGYHWNFRRSAGQPAIINLSYGLIAAALAQLTDGLIYSDDGAWDYSLFPTQVDDFISHYFIPEKATNSDYKEWAETCIKLIYKELNEKKFE